MIINALPMAFTIVLLAVFALDKLLYLVVFFTPLSLPLSELVHGLGFNMFSANRTIIIWDIAHFYPEMFC